MKTNSLIFLCLLLFIWGCGDSGQSSPSSIPTGGELVIGVDESLMPAIDAAVKVFTTVYPEASITPLYLPEKAVTEKLLENKIQTAVLFRSLTEKEKEYIQQNFGHRVTACRLGFDRVVAVTGKRNPVSAVSCKDIRNILTGRVLYWKQLYKTFEDNLPVRIIIPGSSDIDRFIYNTVPQVSPASNYVIDRTSDVIDYILNNPFTIGLVSESRVRDKDNLLSDIKIITRINKNLDDGSTEDYLLLEVNAITHEPFTGLGSGFISFLAGRKGQLILSKAGIIPVKPIERDINISGSF
ncbi:PstS family phosphate ABC transporter substrate-binding protein [Thermodesulfobacteriota bacterium]